MQRTIIALADAARARLFTYVRSNEVDGLRESLTETTDLVNPARRRTPAELFSDTRTSSSRVGHRGFGVDDHRTAHIDEMDAEFAREIAAAIEQAIRDTGAGRVILCASPRLLGVLRTTDLHRDGLSIEELARDYVKMTPTQIREALVGHGLLPPALPRVTSGARAL